MRAWCDAEELDRVASAILIEAVGYVDAEDFTERQAKQKGKAPAGAGRTRR